MVHHDGHSQVKLEGTAGITAPRTALGRVGVTAYPLVTKGIDAGGDGRSSE